KQAELSALLAKALEQPGVAEAAKVYEKYQQSERVNQMIDLFQSFQSPTIISVSSSSTVH
ncbi:MAG TPA: hypothetical protein VF751_11420, partial [Chthoniobacterales bacterium]